MPREVRTKKVNPNREADKIKQDFHVYERNARGADVRIFCEGG